MLMNNDPTVSEHSSGQLATNSSQISDDSSPLNSDKDKRFYRCYLGLGGNLANELGAPTDHINSAFAAMKAHPDIVHARLSSLYTSKPMGPQDQPDFINAVVEIDTTLTPLSLLAFCQQLEQQAERVRLRHWGERSLDVDVLLIDDEKIDLPTLTVPHPGLFERNFVLVPLAELNPKLTIQGQPIQALTASKDWSGLTLLS